MSANDPNLPEKDHPAGPLPAEAADGDSLAEIDLGNEGAIEFGELPPSQEASRVALAQLPEPPSGQSLTTWTEVIRRQRAAQEGQGSGAMRVDSPSDKDLLTRLAADENRGDSAHKRAGDTSEILESELPVFGGPAGSGDSSSGSAIDPFRAPIPAAEGASESGIHPFFGSPVPPTEGASESGIDLGRALAGRAAGGSEIRFDILYPPSDAGGAIPLPADLPPLSGDNLPKGTAVPLPIGSFDEDEAIPFALAVGPGLSGLDLGSDASFHGGDDGRSSILDVLLSESKLVETPASPPARSLRPTMATGAAGPDKLAVPTQPGIEVPEDPIDLSDPDSTPGSDEAVDLLADASSPPSITDSGTLEISDKAIEQSQRRIEQMESSAIDLDSHPSSAGSVFDLDTESNSHKRSDADIDLDLPPLEADASGSQIHPQEDLDANSKALSAELKARRHAPPTRARSSRPELVPVREPGSANGRRNLLLGSAIGLLVGVGGMLAAYFGGLLPGRDAKQPVVAAAADPSAELVALRQQAEVAKQEAVSARNEASAATASVRKTLTEAGVANPDQPADAVRALAAAKAAAEIRIQQLTNESNKNRQAATAQQKQADEARRNLKTAQAATATAQNELNKARKFADAARQELTDAKKVADDRFNELRTTAEAREKEAAARVAELTRKETELARTADAAKKAAEEAARARDASTAVLKDLSDRLVKARFVGAQADATALVKGLDDALKAAATDATATLRDELARSREVEAKLKTDLATAQQKTAEATKIAAARTAEAEKLSSDLSRATTDSDRLAKQAADATARAATAVKAAESARMETDRLTGESARLKTENDRLLRDLETVRELAAMIKAGPTVAPGAKLEPGKLADRFFGDGLRAFYAGRYTEAESDLRKAVQFRPDDARYHYLLGLSLWMTRDTAAAEAEFEKGRDLELAGRPSSRAVSAILERIQGPARQAVNAYRP